MAGDFETNENEEQVGVEDIEEQEKEMGRQMRQEQVRDRVTQTAKKAVEKVVESKAGKAAGKVAGKVAEKQLKKKLGMKLLLSPVFWTAVGYVFLGLFIIFVLIIIIYFITHPCEVADLIGSWWAGLLGEMCELSGVGLEEKVQQAVEFQKDAALLQ